VGVDALRGLSTPLEPGTFSPKLSLRVAWLVLSKLNHLTLSLYRVIYERVSFQNDEKSCHSTDVIALVAG
jgi:hypothetical protein